MATMKCTVSGSFRRFYKEICKARRIFEKNGIIVLSPSISKIVNPQKDFPMLESDSKESTKKEIEDKHLEAIEKSDFLYVVCPGGYIGNSVRFEMGYAQGREKLIYSSDPPKDILLKKYIEGVFSPQGLCKFLRG